MAHHAGESPVRGRCRVSQEHACFRQIISRGCVVQVERCTCGTLHLVLGPLSLRLSPQHYESLIATLLEAQSVLEQRAECAEDASSAGLSLATLLSQTVARGES